MHISMRVLTGAAATAVLGLAAWAPAQADPVNAKGAFAITVTCDNGMTYDAVSNGNGTFAPAHDTGSTAVLVPISFGETTFTVYDPSGTVVDSETDPGSAKTGASAHNKNGTLSCSYMGGTTAPDGSSFVVEGTVVGFVTK